jgi:subtilase family serine protease
MAAYPLASSGAASAAAAGASPSLGKATCATSFSPRVAECFARLRTNAAGAVMSAVAAPVPGSYGPAEFHGGYNLPTSPAGGASQTIAIVDAFSNPAVVSDLAIFNAQYGLPAFPNCTSDAQTACLAVLNQSGNPSPLPPEDIGWGLEIALDVQMAHEICQTCRINLYEANDNQFTSLEAAVNTAAAQGANAISNSYGSFGFDCNEPGYKHPQIAVTVSSGDSGFGVSCPSQESWVVSVGGTNLQLNPDKTWKSESVWSGGGSGCSNVQQAPKWQTLTANWTAIGCTKRGAVDVSADADPNTGASVYDSRYPGGPWFQVGGTSLSSPLIAAVYALAANANTAPYPAILPYKAQIQGHGGLHDVTTGSNGSCGTHTLQCHAGTGYDLPTGVGTPNGIGAF